MTILCLETSTKVCSVALGANGKLLALKESADEKYSHAENLTLFIEEVCKNSKISLKEIDAVAVSKGPGSFTGLRIGVSAAKGLCYALGKPLIGINSLEAMAAGCISRQSSFIHHPAFFCPMIDAKRMEVYCAVYDQNLKEIFPTSAVVIDEHFLERAVPSQSLMVSTQYFFFGDGAAKCRSAISHPNAAFIDDVHPSARHMRPLAEKCFSEGKFEDLAYFEPYYLKDFFTAAKKQA